MDCEMVRTMGIKIILFSCLLCPLHGHQYILANGPLHVNQIVPSLWYGLANRYCFTPTMVQSLRWQSAGGQSFTDPVNVLFLVLTLPTFATFCAVDGAGVPVSIDFFPCNHGSWWLARFHSAFSCKTPVCSKWCFLLIL